MAEPIVFISRNKIKGGRAEEFRKYYGDSVSMTSAGKPRTLAQLTYENEQATEVTVVRLFPDADALDLQLQGASERSRKTYEFIEPIGVEIFGVPNPSTVEVLKKIAGSGVIVNINPRYLGGFIR